MIVGDDSLKIDCPSIFGAESSAVSTSIPSGIINDYYTF